MTVQMDLVHLNRHLLAGLTIYTTGQDFEKDDIWSLAIIPVDGDYKRNPARKWLELLIKPEHEPDWDNFNHQQRNVLRNAIDHGIESDDAKYILDVWFKEQKLGEKKIAPISHNYPFANRFLRSWLGNLTHEEYFADNQARDTQATARFCNDICDFRAEPKFWYPKVDLYYIANVLNVERDYGKHTTLSDTAVTIDCYRAQMNRMNLSMIF